ncbi:Winged helix-turn-helix transcription repressor DNA-binding [Penicillium sp. IBT 31633x]|nr:Winged helix-turn-helix transcription repressor DNA-binding [Penicillium sp. IBT 31633x]
MSLRGPMRRSHLRQVSAASLESSSTHSLETSNPGHEQDQATDERTVRLSSTSWTRHQCALWVHDETFSREEILFNSAAFGDSQVQVGDVVEILPMWTSGDAGYSTLKPEAASKAARESHAELNSTSQADSTSKFKTPLQSRCLFVVKALPPEIRARHPQLEISVTNNIANIFGFKNRTQVLLAIVDRDQCAASHVDIAFRDQYMVRSDMWRLVMSELSDKIIYKGQKITFMGSIKATVKNIFIREKKCLSGYFSPRTIPIFRSESAKYVLFIQMSKEMWDFDAEGTGDILFSRVINGFLPELFKRWASSDVKHLVTIVLFTRVEYDMPNYSSQLKLSAGNFNSKPGPNKAPTRDFYRVVVNDMASGHWTTILDELKREFRTFLRDVSILKTDEIDATSGSGTKIPSNPPNMATIAGRPSSALRGNILEAIHLASAHLAFDHIDRDMVHTGTSIIVITPGSGVFEVSYESLASTTEALANRGIAIDLVCLSPMPLHSVPLFKYREPVEQSSGDLGVGGPSETHRDRMSPDIHHSLSSVVSRTSYLSPSSYFSASRMRERETPRTRDWSFGIPHWLDISYWNPETYREARRILKKDPNAPISLTVTRPSKAFTPRVRMYEIQMMGVMESEQANITIPYLTEERSARKLCGSWPGNYPANRSVPKARFANPLSFKEQLSDSLRPRSFIQTAADKNDSQARDTQSSRREVMAWMDRYDENIFTVSPKRQVNRTPKAKRPSESEVHAAGAGVHERLSARSITRLRHHETNPGDENDSIHSGPRRIDSNMPTPRSPSSVQSSSPIKPALKKTPVPMASRISRTISFALRGLSSTPPRASPSTGVNVEHASAMPMTKKTTPAGSISDARSITSLSPSETASTTTVFEVLSSPSTPTKSSQTPSKPISIKIPPKNPPKESEQPDNAGPRGSFPAETSANSLGRNQGGHVSNNHKIEITLNPSPRDLHTRNSPSKALSPWVRSVNPCNTPKDVLRDTSWFGRWQHAYPRPPHVAVVKWKSLKSPAVLPLTTEEFPTASELALDYLQTPYRVFPNEDSEGIEAPKTRGVLLREMISLRLSHGFQIIIGKHVAEVSAQPALESLNVFDFRGLERDGLTVFLSKGNTIHRLVCIQGGEVEVTRFTHQNSAVLTLPKKPTYTLYQPAMKTILSAEYEVKDIKLDPTSEEYNWNYADNYVAGHRDYLQNPAQQLHFWRVRYVLIPLQLHANSRRNMQSFHEDNEEEIHLLGINQLTHIWQRYKYVSPEEKLFETSNPKRDQNPLNIMYQTRNPSEIVTAELDRLLLTDPGLDNPPAQLLPESELLDSSSINLSSLAQIIQGEKGVRMMDRRWHWRLHYNCFIGFEFTTWLLQNIRDIDTREQAVKFGNELIEHGLFQHVEKRHNFRDGNYFYQVCAEYRVTRPESRGSWFPQLRTDKSMPSTPAVGTAKDSPASLKARSDSIDERIPQTPTTPSKAKNKVAIMLSKSMKYDVDPRKRSNRPEVIDLHWDRLHNPENCFHIELSWMSTTPKLIEDTVHTWAATADKFGLKLVQVPISEACAIDKTQPFRKPYRIKLKIPPPKGPLHTVFNNASFAQPGPPDRIYYQKAILRKFDFVLDFEACSAFPADVEVSYSWGKPDYVYPQFIHRTGSVLAQITDEGDFLILANRLVSTRSSASRDAARFESHNRSDFRGRAPNHDGLDRLSPRLSPITRPVIDISSIGSPLTPSVPSSIDSANLYRAPEHILNILNEFCNDAAQLEQFYSESHARPTSTKVESTTTNLMDASIPSLELPASVVPTPHISPPQGFSRISRDPREGLMSPELTRARARAESLSYNASPRSGGLRPLI